MYTLLLSFVLSAGMALGETAKQGCQSYYEINGVRTCLSSNDAPQEVPDVIGSKLEFPVMVQDHEVYATTTGPGTIQYGYTPPAQTVHGDNTPINVAVADPHSQVADPRNNDYYTQAGSPAHDAALNNTESPFGGAGPDIGFRETYDEHETCAWCGSHEHSDDEHGTPEEDD